MIFRQITSNGDWTFGAGLGNYASNEQAINLNIQTSILMWQGDCFFSLPGWVNWKGLMNVGTQQSLDAALQTLLSQLDGVMAITNASVVVNTTTRAFYATYTIDTVYSQQVTNQIQILSGQTGSLIA